MLFGVIVIDYVWLNPIVVLGQPAYLLWQSVHLLWLIAV
jgi:hypothetical protein